MLLGLVGKPSSGKSTFFKAATLAEVLIAAYPFATIKPNTGVGYVKVEDIGPELGVVPNPNKGYILGKWRFVPIEIMDVAGLVPGASEGKGLGNQFLDDLGKADAFIHVVDASGTTDIEGKVTEGHDPIEDIKFLEEELDKWYLNIFKKSWGSFARGAGKDFIESVSKQFSGLKINEEDVKEAVRKAKVDINEAASWPDSELKAFSRALRLTSKPVIVAANKNDLPGAKENVARIKEEFPDLMVIGCSADSELALREAAKAGLIEYIPGESSFEIKKEVNEKQKAALDKIKVYLDENGNTGVQQVLDKAIFEFLEYIAIFPAGGKLVDSKGNILPDCFLLPGGSTALDFAYYLHTDIGEGFIKAIDARTKQAVGKDHVLEHRDALEIMTR